MDPSCLYVARYRLERHATARIEYLQAENPADFDLRTRSGVQASEVLEVIEFSDPLFESLTGCSTWPAH